MKQYETVIQVMEKNGGFSTLGFLYQEALKVPGCDWKTKTPFATIRRIVQDPRFFFKIRPGLWALKTYEDEIRRRFQISKSDENLAGDNPFNHSYFQGLLVEIGNMNGFSTFVPQQDANRSFLNRQLRNITALNEIPAFTFDKCLRRARTVDVIWFNRREFPDSFFEVEHTTDIQNSLLKFVDLQDFFAKFIIVSHANRKKEFEQKLGYSAFVDIAKRAQFVDYDYVAGLHAKTAELVQYRTNAWG